MRSTAVLVTLLLLASAAPSAAAGEGDSYQLYGNADLAGAAYADVVFHVRSHDGAIDLTVTGPQGEVDTPHGKMGTVERPPPGDSSGSGWIHFWSRLPHGSYVFTITAGGLQASFPVETTSTDRDDWGDGPMIVQNVGDHVLAPPSASGPEAPTPASPEPESPAPASPTPPSSGPGSPTPATPSPTPGTPAPTPAPAADEPGRTKWRVKGLVKLAGAPLEGLTLRVWNHSRTYDLTVSLAQGEIPTEAGFMGLAPQRAEGSGEAVPDYAEFWFDVAHGDYTYNLTSGDMSVEKLVGVGNSGAPAELPHGRYFVVTRSTVALLPAWASADRDYEDPCGDPMGRYDEWKACLELDHDGDGLSVNDESKRNTDPQDPDTDGDGANDKEDNWPLDPARSAGYDYSCADLAQAACDASDADGDGVTLAKEREQRTDPNDPDTDKDGYNDNTGNDKDPLNPTVNEAPGPALAGLVVAALAAVVLAGRRRGS